MCSCEHPAALNESASTNVSERLGGALVSHLQGHLPGYGPRRNLQTPKYSGNRLLWLSLPTGGELLRQDGRTGSSCNLNSLCRFGSYWLRDFCRFYFRWLGLHSSGQSSSWCLTFKHIHKITQLFWLIALIIRTCVKL